MNEYAVERLLKALQSLTYEVKLFREAYVANNFPSSYEPKTEPQTCSTCKFEHKEWFGEECGSCVDCNNWQPKDEPQTCNDCDQKRCETCVTEIGKDEPQTDAETKWLKNEGEF